MRAMGGTDAGSISVLSLVGCCKEGKVFGVWIREEAKEEQGTPKCFNPPRSAVSYTINVI